MFRTAKHILAGAVVIGTAAVPSTALADTAPSSNSAPAASQILITKTVDASSARLVRTSVTGSVASGGQFLGLEHDAVVAARPRIIVRKAAKDQLLD
jgi:uridine phosphorylase